MDVSFANRASTSSSWATETLIRAFAPGALEPTGVFLRDIMWDRGLVTWEQTAGQALVHWFQVVLSPREHMVGYAGGHSCWLGV